MVLQILFCIEGTSAGRTPTGGNRHPFGHCGINHLGIDGAVVAKRQIPQPRGARSELGFDLIMGAKGSEAAATQPEPDQRLLLEKLKLVLPEQPPPKITAQQLATQ